jgi:disulfide bond formation protein DsbB
MEINASQTALGYIMMAVGIIAALGIAFGVSRNAAGLKWKHVLFPIIAIGLGAKFAFGTADRAAAEFKPTAGDTTRATDSTVQMTTKFPVRR